MCICIYMYTHFSNFLVLRTIIIIKLFLSMKILLLILLIVLQVDPCRGPIFFPASLQKSLKPACKDSNHRSKTLNKCEEATPIKPGSRMFNITQGLRSKSGMTWKTEGVRMHWWNELREMSWLWENSKKENTRAPGWPSIQSSLQRLWKPLTSTQEPISLNDRHWNQYGCDSD